MFHVKHRADPELSAEIRERLLLLAAEIQRWSPKIQLVSARDLADLWGRHIADSAQLAEMIPEGISRAVDIGSGAGFPGLVLAIVTNIHFDLIESDRRKAAFLNETARRTLAPVTVHAVRVEDAKVAPARLVTARALAPLERLLFLTAPLLAPDGSALFPKGRLAEQEVAAARQHWRFRVEHYSSNTSPEGQILRITDLAHV